MSDEAKRIVAEETWEWSRDEIATGDGFVQFTRTAVNVQGTSQPVVTPVLGFRRIDARIASCAPEALRMLLDVELKGLYRRCTWCAEPILLNGTIDHNGDCAWRLLMEKAGLR